MVPPEFFHYEIVKEQEASSAAFSYANPAEVLIMATNKIIVNSKPGSDFGGREWLAQLLLEVCEF